MLYRRIISDIMKFEEEITRIESEYRRRDADPRLAALYGRLEPAVIYIRHEIERHIAFFLKRGRYSAHDVSRARLLDAGCGGGTFFNSFVQLGFAPGNLFGAELLYERAASARGTAAAEGLVVADALALPFNDSSFDFVSQFTVFSSVICAGTRRRLACEMRRVTKNGGYIISYDMLYTNPFNKNLSPLKSSELEKLFGSPAEISWRIVLNPIILRKIIKYSKPLCDVITAFKIFNAFNIAFIKVEK